MKNLAHSLKQSKNVALIVGAGISYDAGIPLGFRVPMQYGEAHQALLKKYNIFEEWQQAQAASGDSRQKFETQYVQALVAKFTHAVELQQTFLDWLSEFKTMSGADSDTHAAFVIAWLKRIFNHLVTTNWDFLLEYQAEIIYEDAYLDPFESITHTFGNGRTSTISPDNLFFLEALDPDETDYFWHPRWDIIAQQSDLNNLQQWTRPIWKIHGSPFFLACPKCGGFSRWKHTEKLNIGDTCSDHPEEILKPEIIFWGQTIDTADVKVWKRLLGRLNRSDMIIACGFSGAGSDAYLRTVIENHPNSWLVNPDEATWDVSSVNFVKASASEFANMLIEEFLT